MNGSSGNFAVGCFECGRLVASGNRDASLAAQFDRYRTPTPRSHPAMLDFALSNRCNLRCVQCSGTFSSSIRRERERRPPLPAAYDDRFFEELDEFIPGLERTQFKGGEPFLIPENRRVWDRILTIGRQPEVCITTNGTIWNDRVAGYVETLGADLIISVDAVDPKTLAAVRVGIDPERGRGRYAPRS